eukprot:gene13099-17557_t
MLATILTTLFFMIVLVLWLEAFNSWSNNWKLLKPKPINVSPFQQFMVKSIDDYRIEAQKNLGPKNISENMKLKYSFQQVVKDLLKEFELNLKDLLNEFELNYTKTVISKEFELNYTKTIASEINKQLESFYLSKLSYVTQRVIIEKLFTEFISYYKYDANFTAFIDNSGLEKDLLNNLKSSDPKMTKINLVMNKGSLSEVVHNLDLQSIVILSDISDEWKLTYRYLGEHFQFKVIVVDALMAAAVVGNLVLAVALLIARIFKNLYFGSLREVEVELLIEKSKYTITETCLALTIFRNEVTPPVISLFGSLILIKLLHKLSKSRLDYLEQLLPLSFYTQLRFGLLLFTLLGMDIFATYTSARYVLQQGKSVVILFGFEFGLLVIYACNLTIRFILQLIDANLPNGLTSRGFYSMLTDLICETIKFVTYIAFFGLIFKFYGVPIHIMRDVWSVYWSFYSKLISFVKYLKLSSNLDSRFPDATEEEIATGGNCLVCREEMNAGKKLPCGHIFHLDCLRMWLQHQQSCPLCRADIPIVIEESTQNQPQQPQENLIPEANNANVINNMNVENDDYDNEELAQYLLEQNEVKKRQKNDKYVDSPKFYIVVAKPYLRVMSEPIHTSKEVRVVSTGTVLFVYYKIQNADGSAWLKVPEGWVVEKPLHSMKASGGGDYSLQQELYMIPVDDIASFGDEESKDLSNKNNDDNSSSSPGKHEAEIMNHMMKELIIKEKQNETNSNTRATYSRQHLPDKYFTQKLANNDGSNNNDYYNNDSNNNNDKMDYEKNYNKYNKPSNPIHSQSLKSMIESSQNFQNQIIADMNRLHYPSVEKSFESLGSMVTTPRNKNNINNNKNNKMRELMNMQKQIQDATNNLSELSQSIFKCQQNIMECQKSLSCLILDELEQVEDSDNYNDYYNDQNSAYNEQNKSKSLESMTVELEEK